MKDDRKAFIAQTSLALQVMGLLAAGLLVAQVATVCLVVLLPPSGSVYQLDQIASALKGGPLGKRGSSELVRTRAPQWAARTGGGWISADGAVHDLAALAGAPVSDVRLQFYSPLPFAGLREGVVGPPGAADRGRRPHAGRIVPNAAHMARPVDGRPVRDDFLAALKQPDGTWVMVSPAPDPFLNEWQRRVLVWFLVCFAVLAPIGYLFARRLAAPLRDFAQAAERLGRDPLGDIPPLRGPAEIGPAARAFNTMHVRLKRYVEDRTAMVGAISHDLRTPLTRIRFKLEGAPPALRQSIGQDLRQMEDMISSVLHFIRDAAEPGPRDLVDLRSLLQSAVDDCALTGRDATLNPDGPSPVVEVEVVAMQRLFSNLVENAIKYGGRACVSLSESEDGALIEVKDEGPGLPPEELERVFLPFYRSQAARTLDQGGIGLGLAVARSIARAHGGDVDLVNNHPGLTARVRLPLAPGMARKRADRAKASAD